MSSGAGRVFPPLITEGYTIKKGFLEKKHEKPSSKI